MTVTEVQARVREQILFTVGPEEKKQIANHLREQIGYDDAADMVIELADFMHDEFKRLGHEDDYNKMPGQERICLTVREAYVLGWIRCLETTAEASQIGFNEVFGGEQHG